MTEKKEHVPWLYNAKEVTSESVPEGAVGFVYRITRYGWPLVLSIDTKSKIYIGKKSLTSTRKKSIGKRAQAKQAVECGDKRRVKKVERVVKDSGWMSYNSSNKILAIEIEDTPRLFCKEILQWCYSKKQMTYYEIKYMMLEGVLEKESYNDNIQGTIFRHDINKELYEKYREEQRNKPKKPRVKKDIPY